MKDRLLLCTDLDRTVLPNGAQTESTNARKLFAQLTTRPEVSLVYVTGRHKSLVQQAIRDYALPQPDFVISDVGTCIYDLRANSWQHWYEWEREISSDWAGLTHADLCEHFSTIKALRLQEREKQNTYKLSYYVALEHDEEKLMQQMQRVLEQEDGIKASLIWSIDEPAAIGLLDVLPRSATKLHAIQFLREQLGFTLDETLFAGDSGNDLPVLTSPVRSILVANASKAVRERALAKVKSSECGETLYIATGGFLGMNGNYSAGILEGVAHYVPELGAWLRESVAAQNVS